MKHPSSLRQRFLLASFAMAFVICFLFSLGLFGALEFAESVLFDDRVESDIRTFMSQYEIDPGVVSLPREDYKVFIAQRDDHSGLPDYLRDLPQGSDDVFMDGREYHVDTRLRGDTIVYFMFDETPFEDFDKLLTVVVPAIIFLICALAVALGFVFSNRIVRPVTALAAKVNRTESTVIPAAEDRGESGDEIEVLARAIDNFQGRVTELLSRERDFSSDVSHELRTPLMGIQAAADNLALNSGGSERVAELAQRIQKRCGQMRALVDALLSLARDPHSLENDFRALRLRDVVRDQVDAAGPHLGSRGVKIHVIEEANPAVFTSDAVLNVVIGNILRNAIIHSDSSEIHIRVTGRGLSIQDFGQGVPNEMKNKMFDRFSSAGADPTRDFGIGLALVQRLCAHFKWTLNLVSTPGDGTTISIEFGGSIRD
ncbi:MAG: HAMP domain-containing histidine kinase [Gammaproteobacteria bacterium]|nr:HAMP domain-containing histidine kinase [Gammaproteobacteria bacterium]